MIRTLQTKKIFEYVQISSWKFWALMPSIITSCVQDYLLAEYPLPKLNPDTALHKIASTKWLGTGSTILERSQVQAIQNSRKNTRYRKQDWVQR